MENSQKERIERELRFLKGSLDAGIISRVEYEKGVQRIEKKRTELEIEEPKPEISEKAAEEITVKEIGEEPIEKETNDEKKEPPIEESKTEEQVVTEEATLKEEKEQEVEEFIEKNNEKPEEKPKKSKKKFWALAVIVGIIIVFIIIQNNKPTTVEPEETIVPEEAEKIFIECYEDSDCEKQGKIGKCNNSGTGEASCTYIDPVKVGLTVITSEGCISCDPTGMLDLLGGLFPGIEVNSIEFDSTKGKKLITSMGIEALPAFMFDSKINETMNFAVFKQALNKKEESYLVKNSASFANFYFKRQEIPKKLEMFTLTEENPDLDKSIEEVKDLFGNEIEIKITFVNDAWKITLEKQLGITTYPTFLINNQLKFGGIQPPETIKNKFCESNDLKECTTTLSTVIS